MEQDSSGKRAEVETQIATILVIADQLAVIAGLLRQQVEATREQTVELRRIADALSAK
jgi:hypothetical protein